MPNLKRTAKGKMNDEIETQEYRNWIADLKRRYHATQVKAAVAVNSALIEYYWGLGKDISEKRQLQNLRVVSLRSAVTRQGFAMVFRGIASGVGKMMTVKCWAGLFVGGALILGMSAAHADGLVGDGIHDDTAAIQGGLDVGRVTIRNLSREETKWDRPTFLVEKDVKVGELIVRDAKMVNRLGKPIAFFECDGRVEKARFENLAFEGDWRKRACEACQKAAIP